MPKEQCVILVPHDNMDFDVDSEPSKCPRKPLFALPDGYIESIYRLFEITFKPRSYPSSMGGGTTVITIWGMLPAI